MLPRLTCRISRPDRVEPRMTANDTRGRAFIGIVIALSLVGFVVFVTEREAFEYFSSFMVMVREEHLVAAVLIYIVSMVIATTVLALPGSAFGIIAGALFGPLWGTLWCVLGASLGAVGSFLVGRYFLRDVVRERLESHPQMAHWLSGEHEGSILVLAVTRLIPIFPFNLQNFAYGATDMNLSTYTFWSTLFLVPGTAIYTFLAGGLLDEEHRMFYVMTAIVLSGIVALVAYLMKRRFVQRRSIGS